MILLIIINYICVFLPTFLIHKLLYTAISKSKSGGASTCSLGPFEPETVALGDDCSANADCIGRGAGKLFRLLPFLKVFSLNKYQPFLFH